MASPDNLLGQHYLTNYFPLLNKSRLLRLIREGKHTFSLLAKIFEMNLYKVEKQEMGLKSMTLLALAILGIKVMAVTFTDLRSLPEWKKLRIVAIISCPTISHVFLKKSAGYPSGPGALFLFRENIASLIPEEVTGAIKALC
jgi:hypothetical protein